MILKDFVTEPVVVKTVSYFKVSEEMFILALVLVINESFLHELIKKQLVISNKQQAAGDRCSCDTSFFILQI